MQVEWCPAIPPVMLLYNNVAGKRQDCGFKDFGRVFGKCGSAQVGGMAMRTTRRLAGKITASGLPKNHPRAPVRADGTPSEPSHWCNNAAAWACHTVSPGVCLISGERRPLRQKVVSLFAQFWL
jgi:hypothetical protein